MFNKKVIEDINHFVYCCDRMFILSEYDKNLLGKIVLYSFLLTKKDNLNNEICLIENYDYKENYDSKYKNVLEDFYILGAFFIPANLVISLDDNVLNKIKESNIEKIFQGLNNNYEYEDLLKNDISKTN